MRNWFQKNVNVGHWIIIFTLIAGFIATNAVRVSANESTAQTVQKLEPQVIANDQHRTDENIHMPYAEKVKVFVPRTEFDDVKDDVKELKQGQQDIYNLLVERLPQ
jgi:hypothetical protein